MSHIIGTSGLPRSRIKDILQVPEIPDIWVEVKPQGLTSAPTRDQGKGMSGVRRVAREMGVFVLGWLLEGEEHEDGLTSESSRPWKKSASRSI